MGIFDRFKSMFGKSRLNVSARFEILREAVTGTMSKFYAVRDRENDRVVGLKILDPEKLAAFEARFPPGVTKPSEGEIATSLKHPLLMEAYEYGLTTDGKQYLVVELVEGDVLSGLLTGGPPPELRGRTLPLIMQMAQAVEAVHEAGYVHRDICSRNYICSKDRARLKLIDFGLTVPDRKEFQQPGNRTGTPQYMAPEIVRRRPTDARVDIFALGVTMYQTLSGQHPWPGADVTGKAALAHDTVDPIPLLDAAPDVAPELAEVVMRCLSVDPAGRPESAKALVSRLRRIRQERV